MAAPKKPALGGVDVVGGGGGMSPQPIRPKRKARPKLRKVARKIAKKVGSKRKAAATKARSHGFTRSDMTSTQIAPGVKRKYMPRTRKKIGYGKL